MIQYGYRCVGPAHGCRDGGVAAERRHLQHSRFANSSGVTARLASPGQRSTRNPADGMAEEVIAEKSSENYGFAS
jgi:hypothetical protein